MDEENPMTETVTVLKADLDTLVAASLRWLPDDLDTDARLAFDRLYDARYETPAAGGDQPEPLPDGIFGRVELPGWRNHTGWITDEVRFGEQMCVVRDWDGRVIAMVKLGPACQVLPLPTPLKRPEPRLALPAGRGEDQDPDEDLTDEHGPF
jgi:hypothetical protein